MDRAQALEILEVEESATAEQVRRAYLRAAKAHPPEREPEAFRRVREAFEALSSARAGGPVHLEPSPSGPEARSGPVAEDAPSASLAPLDEDRELDRILGLLTQGEGQAAYEALIAFDERAAALGVASAPALAARLVLVKELTNLLGAVPSEVGLSLTNAVRTQSFLSAGQAVERAIMAEGPSFARLLAHRAPHLLRAVAPYVDTHRFTAAAPAEMPERSAFRAGIWVGPVIALVVVARLFLNLGQGEARRETQSRREPAPIMVPASKTAYQEQDERLDTDGAMVDHALGEGNCSKLARYWEVYRNDLRASGRSPEWTAEYEHRRSVARTKCPDLALLERELE